MLYILNTMRFFLSFWSKQFDHVQCARLYLDSSKGINPFFILSGYYFLMQSSVYLFTVQEMFESLRRLKRIFTDEHLKGKELAS
jgi:hypothetical protein